jgi:5-oxoprolinase (ATP-hydrolysing)
MPAASADQHRHPRRLHAEAAYPAAVVAGNTETSQHVTNAMLRCARRAGQRQGTMNNLTFGNARYQYYETICSGARPAR